MHQFDEYINSIVNDLEIDKEHKSEIKEEFNDHLEMLKQEYIKKGLSDGESVEKAIKDFGSSKELNKKLSDNLINYRSMPNIVFGLLLSIIVFVFAFTSGVSRSAESSGLFTTDASICLFYFIGPMRIPISVPEVFIYVFAFLCDILMFIPVGYFLPILFKKMKKACNVIYASAIIGLLFEIFSLLRTHYPVPYDILIPFAIIMFISSIIGGRLGYALLISLNKAALRRRDMKYKRS